MLSQQEEDRKVREGSAGAVIKEAEAGGRGMGQRLPAGSF